MKLHHVGVRVGQGESRFDTASRTDRAKQIGVVVALVGALSGARSTPGLLAEGPFFWAIQALWWNQMPSR